MGDAHALRLLGASSSSDVATIGGIFPEVVLPADVAAALSRLDPTFVSTNATVLGCTALAASKRDGWAAFYAEWRKIADKGVRFLQSWEAQLDLIRRYESQLEGWQEMIGQSCALSSPIVHAPSSGGFPVVPVVLVGLGAVVVGALGYSFYRAGRGAAATAGRGRALFEGAADRAISARFGGSPPSSPAPRRSPPVRRPPVKRSKSTALARVR